MATSDGSKKVEDGVLDATAAGDTQARRARTAAEQRADRSSSGSPDPDVLVDEIERTREDLAETLDAIADKVSPKRVASRTKRKVSDAVKEGAAEATAVVKEKAAEASEVAKAGAASVKETAEHVKESVQEKVQSHGSTTTAATVAPTTGALADASDTASLRVSGLEPAGADIPPLPAVTSSTSVTTYGASPGGLPKELLAGAGAAVAVLLFVLRRRRRR